MNAAPSDAILERMMSLHPKVIDLTLNRTHEVLAALGHPERNVPPCIHLAGTNGKGSTQAMIRAGLEAAGKQVHAYTSPHLARFHERIRLAGSLITEKALGDVLDRCIVATGGAEVTYFEATTCAAFLAFSETPADYLLLETGLGGRFDTTNVIDKPALTVITPISIDHTQYLGETLAEIASAKAGIIKRGVPCIVGPQPDEAMQVIEAEAARLGAPLIAQGQHWHVFTERGRLIFQDETGLLDLPSPVLIGNHQIDNAGAAIAALRALGCDDTACQAAMTNATWPARMQRLNTGPLVAAAAAGNAELWLDGGHNPAAGAALAQVLETLPKRPTFLICGMLNTKDTDGFLRPLARATDRLFAVSIPDEQNTLTAQQTAKFAVDAGMNAEISADAATAIATIVQNHSNARILICGSLYLAGNVLRTNS